MYFPGFLGVDPPPIGHSQPSVEVESFALFMSLSSLKVEHFGVGLKWPHYFIKNQTLVDIRSLLICVALRSPAVTTTDNES